MARLDEHGSTLSVHRAFVVHLGAGGEPKRRRYSGRVEHLSSGESTRFSSLQGLLAFFAAILDAPSPAALRGKSARTTTDLPSKIDRGAQSAFIGGGSLPPPPRPIKRATARHRH
jgi:hypothetical protein